MLNKLFQLKVRFSEQALIFARFLETTSEFANVLERGFVAMSDAESKSGGEYERKRRYEEEDSNSIADEPESTYVPLRERKKQLVNTIQYDFRDAGYELVS